MSRTQDAMAVVFSKKKGTLGISFAGQPFEWINDKEDAITRFRDLESRPKVVSFTSKAGNECLRFADAPLGYESRWESA